MTGLHGPFDHAVRRITVPGIHHRLAIAHLSLLACLVAAPAIAAELTLPAGGCPLPPDNVPALPDVAPGMTVVQAISMAGGFSSLADRDATVVTRRIDEEIIRYRVPVDRVTKGQAADIEVAAGDIIFVPERMF